MQQENNQQLNNDFHAPPYTDERNPLTNTQAQNRKLNPRSRDFAFATAQLGGLVSWCRLGAYLGILSTA